MRALALLILLFPAFASAQVGGYAAELKCLDYQTDDASANTSCQTSEPLNFDTSFWKIDGSQQGGFFRSMPDSEDVNCPVNGGTAPCKRELGRGVWVPDNNFCRDGWVDEPVGSGHPEAGIMHLSQVSGASANLPSIQNVLRVLEPSRFGGFYENSGSGTPSVGTPNPIGLLIQNETLCARYYFSFEDGYETARGTDVSSKWMETYLGAGGTGGKNTTSVGRGAFPSVFGKPIGPPYRYCDTSNTPSSALWGGLTPNGNSFGWTFPNLVNELYNGNDDCETNDFGGIDTPPSTNKDAIVMHENCTQGSQDPDGGTGWCRMEVCWDHNLAPGLDIGGTPVPGDNTMRWRAKLVDIDTGEESFYSTYASITTNAAGGYTGFETVWNNFFQKEPREGNVNQAPYSLSRPEHKAQCCRDAPEDSCTIAQQKDPALGYESGTYQHLPADRFFSHLMVARKSDGAGRGVGDWWLGAATEITEDIDSGSVLPITGTLSCDTPVSAGSPSICTALPASGGDGGPYTWNSPDCDGYGIAAGTPTLFTCEGISPNTYNPTSKINDNSSGANPEGTATGTITVDLVLPGFTGGALSGGKIQ